MTASSNTLQAAVYHRDLKLENALINISAGSAPYLKIADFGFSKVTHSLLMACTHTTAALEGHERH